MILRKANGSQFTGIFGLLLSFFGFRIISGNHYSDVAVNDLEDVEIFFSTANLFGFYRFDLNNSVSRINSLIAYVKSQRCRRPCFKRRLNGESARGKGGRSDYEA